MCLQLRQLMWNCVFDLILEGKGKEAWEALRRVEFIENRRIVNYTMLITTLVQRYHQFSPLHLDFFVPNLELSVTSMAKGSIKTFPLWNRELSLTGMKHCLRITARIKEEMFQRSFRRERPKNNELMTLPLIFYHVPVIFYLINDSLK